MSGREWHRRLKQHSRFEPPSSLTTGACPARTYNCYLGGDSNFAADRELASGVTKHAPLRECAWQTQAFLRRAVTFLAQEAGIRQFLHLNPGIPTVSSVHEVVPDARVVYVESDPILVAHSKKLLRAASNASVAVADFRFPVTVLKHPVTTELLDLRQPVAVLMLGVLEFVSTVEFPRVVVSEYVSAISSGSYLALSHATHDSYSAGVAKAAELYRACQIPFSPRSEGEVARMFAGLELLEPGLVLTPLWRPAPQEYAPGDPRRSLSYAGVGYKPESGLAENSCSS